MRAAVCVCVCVGLIEWGSVFIRGFFFFRTRIPINLPIESLMAFAATALMGGGGGIWLCLCVSLCALCACMCILCEFTGIVFACLQVHYGSLLL